LSKSGRREMARATVAWRLCRSYFATFAMASAT
jgi:hypothetical protein